MNFSGEQAEYGTLNFQHKATMCIFFLVVKMLEDSKIVAVQTWRTLSAYCTCNQAGLSQVEMLMVYSYSWRILAPLSPDTLFILQLMPETPWLNYILLP